MFVTLLALVGAANVLIHRAFHMQKAKQQQATATAKRTSGTSNNNWKPPSADRFAAATNKNEDTSDASTSINIDGADDHPLAGLDCTPHGGPDNEAAAEMVFWEDIESDSKYKSPFLREDGPTQYLTFEPDHGGWNNVRELLDFLFQLLVRIYYFFISTISQLIISLPQQTDQNGHGNHAGYGPCHGPNTCFATGEGHVSLGPG